jgi:MFS family permease
VKCGHAVGVGVTDRAERLLTGPDGRLSLALAFGWFSLLLGRSALPPLIPSVIDGLSISATEAGLALTVMMAMHSLLQYPGGRVSDELTRATVLVVSLVAASVGFTVTMTAPTYPVFLVGVAAVGTGSGLFFSPARASLSDVYTVRLGQALGIQTTAGLAGSALAGGLATVALAYATWRETFLVPVGLVLVVALLIHLLRRSPYRLERVELGMRETGARLFRRPRIRRLLAAAALRGFVNQAFIGFLPLFLMTSKSFSTPLANASYGALFAVGAVVSPAVGRVGDRFSRSWVLVSLLTTAMVGIGALVVADTVPLVLVGVALTAVGTWGFAPVMQATLMDSFDAESVGGDFGAMKMAYTGLGSLGPTYLGFALARSDYTTAFASLLVALGVGLGLLVLDAHSGGADADAAPGA